MITAEENLFLFLQYGRRKPTAKPGGRPIFRQQVAGGRNMWITEDARPTKKEAREKIERFREKRDQITRSIGLVPPEILDVEPFRRATPWWVVAPFYIAPYVAEGLIELDPLDRLQD